MHQLIMVEMQRAIPTTQRCRNSIMPIDPKSRRDLFKIAGGIGVASSAALLLGKKMTSKVKSATASTAEKFGITLPRPARSLPALPEDPALRIEGLSSLITENANFYQIDIGDNPASIDPATWSLKITGMVKNPMTITFAELLKRPMFELDNTISCVSNSVGGSLIGNARWLGCRLDDLINEAGPLADADQVLSSSSHGFSAGFPITALDGRDAMIAIGMNGEQLPEKHGFPARIIVPGLYGYVSATKWVTQIEITRFDKKAGYWIPNGWSALGPTKMEARIDYPADGSTISVGASHIAGVAWAPLSGIKAVEVKITGGPWLRAELGPELAGTSWRQWWLNWNATDGNHTISVRAINNDGEIQTSTPKDSLPDGAQGWQMINVTAK
jgi:DMSO/TMAO reductase YedYZ molybdopterin-dependent catalytic subunit